MTTSPLGLHIGRYQVVRQLGAGATGVVYLARDPDLGREVAVKLLAHALSQDETAVRRFTEEARVASALDHPRVVTVHEIGRTEDGRLFIAMAYHPGETLRQRMALGPLPLGEAVVIATDIAEGLAAAHAKGIIHRDVKPENILLTVRGACIVDFGIAKMVGADLTQTLTFLGTAGYMSPEQTAGASVDQRADVWSLGVVLYEMLAGQRPFSAESADAVVYAIRHDTPTPVGDIRPEVGSALAAVISRCLKKEPDRRFPSAEAVEAALADPGVLASPTRTTLVRRALRRRLPKRAGAAALLLLGGLALAVGASNWLRGFERPATLDPNLLVVVPFDVLGPELGMWREGLVDVLSTSLDGAGPLRTVAPSAVVKNWGGRADRPSARSLAEHLGAGLAVHGRIVAAGKDSVTLTASILDVASGTSVRDFVVRGLTSRMDLVGDSLAVGVLTALTASHGLGAEPLNSLGSRSTVALRAFLQGEQHFRQMRLDSAVYYYQRAIDDDSTFVLALNRMGIALGWQGIEGPNKIFLRRAGALNHGLAQRESLLVVSDSLSTSFGVSEMSFLGDSGTWARHRRFFSTLELAIQLYPDDAGAWYRLGEAQVHWGTPFRATDRQTLHSFERVAELDPNFAPAYPHLLELTFSVRGEAAGRQLATSLLTRSPAADEAAMLHLLSVLLDPRTTRSSAANALLDTLPDPVLGDAFSALQYVPDSAQTAVRVAKALAHRQADRTSERWFSGAFALALRGHSREANEYIDLQALTPDPRRTWAVPLFSEFALQGVVPRDTAARVYEGWLHQFEAKFLPSRWPLVYLGLAWWNMVGDSMSLDRAAAAAVANLRKSPTPADSARLNYIGGLAKAYGTLARGDSAAAVVAFRALPIWPCPVCDQERLTLAQLLVAAGREGEAAQILEADPRLNIPRFPLTVRWVLERARVNERLGNREVALTSYGYVADVWRFADPILQPMVEEARAAIAHLRAEPAPPLTTER